jgi:LacI family transcriptional regulator
MQLRATQFVELPVDITHVRRHMDAVLMFHCADIDQRLANLWRRGIPGALIGHHPGVSSVAPDDIGGGRLAATHLHALGHRDLLHLTVTEDHQWAVERAAGFTTALAEQNGASRAPVILRGGGSVLGGYRLLRDAWQQGHRPTGIFCATDEMAVGALGALSDLGVSVPGQVSVLGFDGLVDLYPGLASVAQDIPTIAHEAVTLALAAIDRDLIRHTIVPVRIIEGTTLGPVPGKG